MATNEELEEQLNQLRDKVGQLEIQLSELKLQVDEQSTQQGKGNRRAASQNRHPSNPEPIEVVHRPIEAENPEGRESFWEAVKRRKREVETGTRQPLEVEGE